jgi:hypothetical protein
MSSVTDHVQAALAAILTNPTKRLREVVRMACAAEDDRTQSAVFSQAREIMEDIASTPFRQVEGVNEPPPLLINRLSFAWTLLKKADSQIRQTSRPKPQKPVNPLQAAPKADELLHKLLIDDLSSNLLGSPLSTSLQTSLFVLLGVDEKGQFLLHYYDFLKAKDPKKLDLNVIQSDGLLSDRNARRLLRWIIRKLDMKYVDFVDGAMVTHVPFLMEAIGRQFYEWSGVRKDACDAGRIKDLIAEEITAWLSYSCLDGDSLPESTADQSALIRVFQKDNKLTTLVHSAPPQADPIKDRRIAELEADNAKLNEEVRGLESKLAAAQATSAPGPREPATGRDDATAHAVRDVCKAIESKYPLDKLSDAQHSDDPMLSLKSVLSHLFFVLRRQGLTAYPTEDAFDLPYEKAGLFECLSFEVPPGESRQVEVIQRGWAIKCGDRLLPIRRAQIRVAERQ